MEMDRQSGDVKQYERETTQHRAAAQVITAVCGGRMKASGLNPQSTRQQLVTISLSTCTMRDRILGAPTTTHRGLEARVNTV